MSAVRYAQEMEQATSVSLMGDYIVEEPLKKKSIRKKINTCACIVTLCIVISLCFAFAVMFFAQSAKPVRCFLSDIVSVDMNECAKEDTLGKVFKLYFNTQTLSKYCVCGSSVFS